MNFCIADLKKKWFETYERSRREHYQGDKYCCPVCNDCFKIFLDKVDDHHEKKSICPFCYSDKERRTDFFFIAQFSNYFKRNLKILDLSNSPALVDKSVFNEINIDFQKLDLIVQGKDLNLYSLDYPDNDFDFIICNDVLDKIYNEKFFLKELNRIVKDDGIIMIQSDIDQEFDKTLETEIIFTKERERLYGNKQRFRRYGKDYKQRFEKLGYAVDLINYTPYNYNDIIKEFVLIPNYRIYLLVKKGDLKLPISFQKTAELIRDNMEERKKKINILYFLQNSTHKIVYLLMASINKFTMNEEFTKKWLYQFYVAAYGAFLWVIGFATAEIVPIFGIFVALVMMGIGILMPVYNVFGGEATRVKRLVSLFSFFIFIVLFTVLSKDFVYFLSDMFAKAVLNFVDV